MDACSALLRRIHLNGLKNSFVSSSEGFQREAGGSLPLGGVATATNHLNLLWTIYLTITFATEKTKPISRSYSKLGALSIRKQT